MVNVTAVGQIFACEICGNVVEVRVVGGGELVCCGEPMVERK
jgi:desulfoferrodoxin-like iron-binding protein